MNSQNIYVSVCVKDLLQRLIYQCLTNPNSGYLLTERPRIWQLFNSHRGPRDHTVLEVLESCGTSNLCVLTPSKGWLGIDELASERASRRKSTTIFVMGGLQKVWSRFGGALRPKKSPTKKNTSKMHSAAWVLVTFKYNQVDSQCQPPHQVLLALQI